ncbi:MAG TPA: SLC13 family permease, partial [Steroidobacteraceae bacterium]|nr:SLC13 family permease [Steroidobacteraceae bacterium]
MTMQQILAFAVIASTMALFVWGRLRYDLVAGVALLVAVLIGVVPADKAFTGFSDEIVIIVASALIVSAAVARSGIIEVAIQPVARYITSAALQVLVLAGAVAILSAFVKNIGALAMMIPIALQMAKRAKRSPSILLMPMAFGSLLGGTMTLIGTSPNIIVSRLREQIVGEPFGMFDFTPVGAGLSAAGVLLLVF